MEYALVLQHVGLSAEQIDVFLKDAARRMLLEAERAVGARVPPMAFDHIRGDSSLN